jgi:hypothetical protein
MDDSNVVNHYLTAEEAVQLLGCSKRTLSRYVSQGLVGKIGRGKGTRYSGISILMLSRNKGAGKLDRILSQLNILCATQQEILTRLTLLESVFMPRGGTLLIPKAQVKVVREAINNTFNADLCFEDCKSWSDDLLRLSKESCKSIGFKLLQEFTDLLIAKSEQLKKIQTEPKNKVVIERLRWFRHRLSVYASFNSSEV